MEEMIMTNPWGEEGEGGGYLLFYFVIACGFRLTSQRKKKKELIYYLASTLYSTECNPHFSWPITLNRECVWRIFRFYGGYIWRKNNRGLKKRETTQNNPAKLNQPWPNMATPLHVKQSCGYPENFSLSFVRSWNMSIRRGKKKSKNNNKIVQILVMCLPNRSVVNFLKENFEIVFFI